MVGTLLSNYQWKVAVDAESIRGILDSLGQKCYLLTVTGKCQSPGGASSICPSDPGVKT